MEWLRMNEMRKEIKPLNKNNIKSFNLKNNLKSFSGKF